MTRDEILERGETPIYLVRPDVREALINCTRLCENGGKVVIQRSGYRKAVRKARAG
jgi:hypothetical protein